MSSEVAPLLAGFAAVGVLLIAIGIVLAVRRQLERMRLTPQWRPSRESEGWATSQEWVYRTRGRQVRAEPPDPERQGSLSADDEAARRRAEAMLAAAERRCERLLRDSEAEAERRADEIIEDALRQASELLEEVELEVESATARGVPARSGSGL